MNEKEKEEETCAAGWSSQRPITGQRRVSRTGQFLRHGVCRGSILLQDVAPGRFIRPSAVSATRGRTEEERGESRNLRSQFMSLTDVVDAVETGASPCNLPVCVLTFGPEVSQRECSAGEHGQNVK